MTEGESAGGKSGVGETAVGESGVQDIISGVIVVALGAGILIALSRLGAVKYQQIAPDLFPRLCAWGLVIGGLALSLRGFWKAGPALALPGLRQTALIILAIVAFGLVAPGFGYAPAGFLVVFISGMASPDVRPRQLLLLALGLVGFSVLLFSYLLKLTMPILVLPGLAL